MSKDSLPREFRERFTRAFKSSGYTSQRSLSLDAGWSESRINRIISGQFEHSKDGPGFFGLVRVCEKLGITPDYLAGIQKWKEPTPDTTMNAVSLLYAIKAEHKPPSIKSLMRRYVRSGQRLEAFQSVMDYCDLYQVPNLETRKVVAKQVGKRSLSALRMGEANHIIMQDAYDRASEQFQERIFQAQLRAYNIGVTVEPDSIDERMQNRPIHIKIDYIRMTMKLTDADGGEHILTFCELIPQ